MSGNSIAISRELLDEINALRNQLLKLEAKADSMVERMDSEARRNDTRFNILGGFMVANFAVVFALVLQNLFGG